MKVEIGLNKGAYEIDSPKMTQQSAIKLPVK